METYPAVVRVDPDGDLILTIQHPDLTGATVGVARFDGGPFAEVIAGVRARVDGAKAIVQPSVTRDSIVVSQTPAEATA